MGCPVQHTAQCVDRRLCTCNAIVAVCAAEICPFRGIIYNVGVRSRLLKCDRYRGEIRIIFFAKAQNGLPAFIYDLQRTCLCRISVQRNAAIVSEAFRQCEAPILIRPDTISSSLFVNIDQSILRICLECNASCRSFLYCDNIITRGSRNIFVRYLDLNVFFFLSASQIHCCGVF